ncbi:S24/S26 family peptidase [Chloroflexota bacterium]
MSELRLEPDRFESLADEVLSKGDTLRFRARGISMQPFIHDGDILEIQPNGGVIFSTTDIVLCKSPQGHLVAHRVMGTEMEDGRGRLIIQGDALGRPDGSINPGEVLGRVVAVIRDGEYKRVDTPLMRIAARLWIGIAPTGRQFRDTLLQFKKQLTRDK